MYPKSRASEVITRAKVFRGLLAVLVALAAAGIAVGAGPLRPVSAQGGSVTFPETGKTVKGKFLDYWNAHGGLAQQGYPISEEMQEISDTNGKTYTVQYFERAVFEAHPENAAPNDVLLSLLGVFLYKQKYPNGAPNQHESNVPGAVLFSVTGKHVGGLFLNYWRDHGGLAQQGFPISEEFTEVNDLDHQPYTVQYFERAVFEYHPENQAPYNVLLSQLGRFRYRAKYGAGQPSSTATPPPPTATPAEATASPTAALPARYEIRGSVSNGRPRQNEVVTVSAIVLRNGKPLANAPMVTTWNFKTSRPGCQALTGSDGVASCSRNIGDAPIGAQVVIDIVVRTPEGKELTARATFTPQ